MVVNTVNRSRDGESARPEPWSRSRSPTPMPAARIMAFDTSNLNPEDCVMAITQRACTNHPDRQAIGVCVITGQAICAECSTRYEGVNYSREGLRILQERRAAGTQTTQGNRTAALIALLCSPLLLYMLYLFYRMSFVLLIDLQQIDWITGS